jgi:hypothetical protein
LPAELAENDMSKKVEITDASNWVRRLYASGSSYQWARETLMNSLEAKAKRVEFALEWQGVEKLGVYRRIIMDNGKGMDADELLAFFSTLGLGDKKIGGLHDNFGIGAKISLLPWNPSGLVVISYKHGVGSMIWIRHDRDTGNYELVDWENERGRKVSVIDPHEYEWPDDEVDFSALKPDWIGMHGTIILLMGSEVHPDTIYGDVDRGEEAQGATLTRFLNGRFWTFGDAEEVRVVEMKSAKKNQWPESEDKVVDANRPQRRQIFGAAYYLDPKATRDGKLEASGALDVSNGRVRVHWYLWSEKQEKLTSKARVSGYVGYKYKDEVYQGSADRHAFRSFGIIEKAVQSRVTLIVEPKAYEDTNGRWGVFPDSSRGRLVFTGGGEAGVDMPRGEWANEFASNLPQPIYDAIAASRKDNPGTIRSDEYRKRLQDKFGNRWRHPVLVKPSKGYKGPPKSAIASTATANQANPLNITTRGPGGGSLTGNRRSRPPVHARPILKHGAGNLTGEEQSAPVDVPQYDWCGKEDYDQEWHLATWSRERATVFLNRDAKLIQDTITYYQDQYPEQYAEEIVEIVKDVFGEVACCKVAHAQQLAYVMSESEIDENYLTDEALTIALMGLISEETIIAQRLGKLGRKKVAVVS